MRNPGWSPRTGVGVIAVVFGLLGGPGGRSTVFAQSPFEGYGPMFPKAPTVPRPTTPPPPPERPRAAGYAPTGERPRLAALPGRPAPVAPSPVASAPSAPESAPSPSGSMGEPGPLPELRRPPTLLGGEVRPIDLGTAFRLANLPVPGLVEARARVLEEVAVRQIAASQLLPTLNGGSVFDARTRELQQASAANPATYRDAVYVGSGAFSGDSGRVVVPGVLLAGDDREAVYRDLSIVRTAGPAAPEAGDDGLLRVALAYCELIRAEGRRAVAEQFRDQSEEVARIVEARGRSGQGRPADAHRARTDLAGRQADVRRAEEAMQIASSRLGRTLHLDPSIRLHPTDAYAVPIAIVPDPIPLRELVAMAALRRPELGEARVAVAEALARLEGTRALPFAPTILIGFSGGGPGGDSNLVRANFAKGDDRADSGPVAAWTCRNFGVASGKGTPDEMPAGGRDLALLDRARDEVAEVHARTHARLARIGDDETVVRSALEGFRLDFERLKQEPQGERDAARTVEVLDSLDALARAKLAYLDTIVDYNTAHFELYEALGRPPAANLARVAPTDRPAPVAPSPAPAPALAPAPPPSPAQADAPAPWPFTPVGPR